jgi:hypothetical protein
MRTIQHQKSITFWAKLAAMAMALGSVGGFGNTPPTPTHAGLGILPPPPECATRTPLSPLTPLPSWAFVVNFDMIERRDNGNEYPVGCIIVWRTPFNPTDFIRVDTCDVFDGMVTFSGGRATFGGGHIRCDVNIKASMAALSPTVFISDKVEFPPFELIGVGKVNAPTTPHPFGNPVMYYRPTPSTEPPVGLFVPALVVDVFGLASVFNNFTHEPITGFPTSADDQTWSAKHELLPDDTYQVVHARDFVQSDRYAPRPIVDIWTNGGTFWIGGSPVGPSFDGSLDEAIADPADRAGPTGELKYEVLVPMVMR